LHRVLRSIAADMARRELADKTARSFLPALILAIQFEIRFGLEAFAFVAFYSGVAIRTGPTLLCVNNLACEC